MDRMIPKIFILTGFLGSGKTTLLVDMLATGKYSSTGFIVNDIGEINIDRTTVLSSGPGLRVANLENGCICCTMAGDLPLTMAALMDENERVGGAPLERIVIETSGLSRPAPIIKQLLGLPIPFKVTVLCTYDCVNGALSSAHFDEAAAQIAAAQTIILTKLDQVSASIRRDCIDRLQTFNPFARIVNHGQGAARVQPSFEPAVANANLRIETLRPASATHGDSHRVKVTLATARRPLAADELFEWLDNMGGYFGSRLLRSKGVFRLQDDERSVLVQSVGSVFERPQVVNTENNPNSIVLIVRDLQNEELASIAPTSVMTFPSGGH